MYTLTADLVEVRSKQDGQIYICSEVNGPVASNDSIVDERKKLLVMPCLAMEEVPESLRGNCFSCVDPYRPEFFFRAYSDYPRRREIYLEGDVDYNARKPATFERDASFIERRHLFFHGYSAFESVSWQGHFMQVVSYGRIEINRIHNPEMRHKASFVGDISHSTWSASFIQVSLLNMLAASAA